jgi:hypothetical protein
MTAIKGVLVRSPMTRASFTDAALVIAVGGRAFIGDQKRGNRAGWIY